MDFLKSVFSPDTEPKDHEQEGQEEEEEEEASPSPNPSESAGSWSFGDLMKTIATRSEFVIQTYRRDLEDFGSGLKKETEAIMDVASRAVLDLPGSLDAGASVAHDSLESVGRAVDEIGGSVWRGAAEIISQSREALLASDSDAETNLSSCTKQYSRFEAQVVAVQNDLSTFVEETEDGQDFERWRLGFRLEEKEEEIEVVLYKNGILEGFSEKFVSGVVDREMFWCRYYYRVYKLQQAEEARARLVKRVISTEEEELSWEVGDEEEEEESEKKKEIKEEIVGSSEFVVEKKPNEEATRDEIVATSEKPTVESTKSEIVENSGTRDEKEPTEASQVENLEEEENDKSKIEDNNVPSESKLEPAEPYKDNDFSVISSQPSMQEEDDLGWDKIEDLGEPEDSKVGRSSDSPRKVDLRKKLCAAEDDEDLSWDIEDDDEDEPAKT